MDNKIKQARKVLGLTQKQLAEKLGVSAYIVSSWELGRRKPKNSTIFMIDSLLRENNKEVKNGH